MANIAPEARRAKNGS